MSPEQGQSAELGGAPQRPLHLPHAPPCQLPESRAWPLSLDATEQSWRGPAVRQRSWVEASPCSRGSPTSPSTVSEQGPPGGVRVWLGASSEEPGRPSTCLVADVSRVPGSWSAN